jgi:hypothetical protein
VFGRGGIQLRNLSFLLGRSLFRSAPTFVVDATLKLIMSQFVIEREIPGAGSLSEAQIRQVSLRSLQALQELGPQIQWLHSYVTEDKVYCVYLAPDENTIREHARRAGIPADRVSAVRRLVSPVNFE